MTLSYRRSTFVALIVCFVCLSSPAIGLAAPAVAPGLVGIFDLTEVSGSFTASMTQMAFGVDGKLYVATFHDGIQRFDYDPAGPLSQPVQVSPIRSLGLAFHESSVHGLCMYLTPFAPSSNDPATIVRLTDDDGDGNWGEAGETNVAIVDNIPVGLHRANQLQIQGDCLMVGIGSRTDVGNDESAYNGTICWIRDLNAVPSSSNAAGFSGADFTTDPIPFTSTAVDKLVIHSSGTRNPFGLGLDGKRRLWMSNNQSDVLPIPPDEFFLATEKGDYGFPASNPSMDWRSNAAVLAAGYFITLVPSLTVAVPDPTYEPDDPTPGTAPGGLGPHSSADGFDFYAGNAYPLRFHHDAFLARGSSSSTAVTGLSETYEDFVAVDLNSGEVVQIADGFTRPLDVLGDSFGNLLFAEFDAGGQGVGRIYRLSATNPVVGAHVFEWGAVSDGNWSDRLSWNVTLPEQDRLVPNAWEDERYTVTLDVAGSSPLITVDEATRIESLTVGDALSLTAPLVVDDDLMFLPDARLRVEIGGPDPGVDFQTTQVGNMASLDGTLEIVLLDGYEPASNTTFDVIFAQAFQGVFAAVIADGQWDVHVSGNALRLRVVHATDVLPRLPEVGFRIAPNPFNPRTSVLLELPKATTVTIRIHDIAGRMLRELWNGYLEAGSQSMVWDGRDGRGRQLASGVYFVQVKAGTETQAARVSLVK